ncbi:MAG: helix-turn-helix domain-containing protein [Candidatus Ornithospirochaeta sp.]
MARKNHSFKRRTVTRWTLSYLLATLIPLFLVLAAALVTLYVNSSSITYSNNITASYVQSSFHDVLSRINEIKAEIIVDSELEELRRVEKLNEMSSLDIFYRASGIRRLEQSSTTVERLFLFSPECNWYISSLSWGEISDMAEKTVLSLSQETIDSMLKKEIWDVYIYDVTDGEVLIVMPVSYIKSTNANNLCVGVIVQKEKLFPSEIDSFHDVVIYSERSDSVVYSLSGRAEVGENDPRLSSLVLGSTQREGNSIVSCAEELIMSLKCIVIMDSSTYFHNYYVLMEVIVLVTLGAIVAGLFFSFSVVKIDWSHYEAAAEASGVDLEKIPLGGGEYAPFVSSVSDLKAEKEELSNMVVKQKRSLLESAFRKLLDGDTTVTGETLSALGVDILSDYFYVAMATSTDGDAAEYLRSFSKDVLVIPFQSEYGEAFIINVAEEDEGYSSTLMEKANDYGGLSSLSVSMLHTGLESIRDCYLDVISVHEYQKDHEIPFLSYAELLATTRQNTYQFTLEENMMLQKTMKEGDGETAKALVNKIIDRNRNNGVSPKMLRYLLFNISGTIIRTINSLDVRYSEVIPEISFPPILQSQNFQKSLSGVEEIIDSTCYSIKAINDSSADQSSETYQVYRKVLDHIHDNYGSSMMNVSSIADNFGISIAYLSRIFKKYHGINISEYITSYRLDRAKSLLSEGRMVGDVVEECGFGSLRTFLRVFKSVEGVTPGQYKSSVAKES